MSYIYKITNKINNKCYIGKTDTQSIASRFKEHCLESKRERNKNRPLYKAFNKYGIENFIIEEIEQCDINNSCEREKYWIGYFDCFKNGYNATLGGDGKAYIDYDLVINTYNKIQNISQVAKELNIHPETIHNVLTTRNINIKSSKQINKEQLGKAVRMLTKEGKFLQTFPSMREAAQYLINNHLSNCKLTTIRCHISEVCKGKRKTAAGYKWEFDN